MHRAGSSRLDPTNGQGNGRDDDVYDQEQDHYYQEQDHYHQEQDRPGSQDRRGVQGRSYPEQDRYNGQDRYYQEQDRPGSQDRRGVQDRSYPEQAGPGSQDRYDGQGRSDHEQGRFDGQARYYDGQDREYHGLDSDFNRGLDHPDADWIEPAQRPARRRRGRLRRLLALPAIRVVLVLLAVLLCWFSWSMGKALTVPGTDTISSRVAEWARDHYLGPLVTLAEKISYKAPKVGGKPAFALTGPSSATSLACAHRPRGTARSQCSHRHAHKGGIRPIVPQRLASLAGKPLPGEGIWRVLGSVRGVPAIYSTFLRPDSVHTAYVAAITVLDQRLLRFQLHPGAQDPGPGNWHSAPTILPRMRKGLLATFNGGFKIDASAGGFYLNGTTMGTMTKGAASLVFYRNGRVTIGVWGRNGLHMTPDVAGVRQNLRPIVDHGAVPATVDSNIESSWGATLGGGYYVWRSGIGITRDGRIVYVYGPALTVRTLANLLVKAGSVEAMQLDINPEWMSFMYYRPKPSRANPSPVDLLPNQQQPADRYYQVSSRDFTAVYAR